MDSRHNQSVARPATATATDQKKGHRGKKRDDASLKVVYISSPMKVRTSAAKFRSLVQELTGKNSDVAQYMLDGDGAAFDQFRHDGGEEKTGGGRHQMVAASDGPAMDSFLGSTDSEYLASQFGGIPEDLYYGACSHWDVLGNYGDLG